MVENWSLPPKPEAGFWEQLKGSRPQLDVDSEPGLEDLPDEGLFANIEEVAQRILRAMYDNEPLVIFGHDDPDGVTSTYILYQFFNSCGYQKHNYYIPNRNIDSHGIQDSFVDFVRQNGYQVAVTVDNGIASYEGVERLKELGCDTLIVDHHLIQPDQLPRAFAILNPQLPECDYPFKPLAGVGVVLMLIRYLGRHLEHEIDNSAYFWTAVGSIADKVPMVGLNRLIVRNVIKRWYEIQDSSVEFLMRNYSRLGNEMDIFNFITYVSRLIANGREENGQHAGLRFLLRVGDEKVSLFQNLEGMKRKWESELNRVFNFVDVITSGFEGRAFIYFEDEDIIPYHLLGTAASYIVSNFGIPTILLKIHNEKMVCEGRCGEGFNIVDAFAHCKEHLLQFGGHPRAAGFTMEPSSYDAFLECYNDFLNINLKPLQEDPPAQVDAVVNLQDLSYQNWELYQRLLPFGIQNPEPLLLVPKTTLAALQNQFQLEYNSVSMPSAQEMDVVIHWKGPANIRVMGYKASEA